NQSTSEPTKGLASAAKPLDLPAEHPKFGPGATLSAPALPLHAAAIVIAILEILHCQCDRLEPDGAICILHRILQIEALDREVIVAISERSAHGCEVRFAHCIAHRGF